MATGQSHRIPRGNAMVTYTEYKLQPSDAGKDLKKIARERLNDENLYKDILRMLEAPNTQGRPWYAEIVQKDRIGSDWTLLLPPAKAIPPQPAPSDLATFKIISKANVRTSPKLDPWQHPFCWTHRYDLHLQTQLHDHRCQRYGLGRCHPIEPSEKSIRGNVLDVRPRRFHSSYRSLHLMHIHILRINIP
ncbi:MAG: hypothetical protein IPJ47_02455 [Anaerolineales bacterium]|nr:hypothetical protein [Anaerolineales bacterium]